MVVTTAGIALALAVLAALAPGPCLLELWALYLSFVSAGRVFLSSRSPRKLRKGGASARTPSSQRSATRRSDHARVNAVVMLRAGVRDVVRRSAGTRSRVGVLANLR
jgi:hypothetical protein